jgi:hypothetical protein
MMPHLHASRSEDAEELLAAQHLAAMAGSPAEPAPRQAPGCGRAGAVGLLDASALRTLGSTAKQVPASASISAFFSNVAAAVSCPPGSGQPPALPAATQALPPDTRCTAATGGSLVVDGPTSVILMQQAASLVRVMQEELLKSQEQVRLHPQFGHERDTCRTGRQPY